MVQEYQEIDDSLLQKKIAIFGIAVRSKAGPCIKLRDGNIVFIHELADWDDDFLHQKVKAVGKLFLKKIIPDVQIDENGAISQGAAGKQHILEDVEEINLAIED
jgi:hypothetical protein